MKSNSTLETRVLNVMTDIYCKCSETAWQGPLAPALVGSDLNKVYCGTLLNLPTISRHGSNRRIMTK